MSFNYLAVEDLIYKIPLRFLNSSLETLSLRSCNLASVNVEYFNIFRFLKEIDLSGNQLIINSTFLTRSKGVVSIENKCPELVWLQTAIVSKLRSSLAQKKTAKRKNVRKIGLFSRFDTKNQCSG